MNLGWFTIYKKTNTLNAQHIGGGKTRKGEVKVVP
jgi:hypothetical protein